MLGLTEDPTRPFPCEDTVVADRAWLAIDSGETQGLEKWRQAVREDLHAQFTKEAYR